MMVKCGGSKRNGSPCTATVKPPKAYCWWHDPANAAERRRNASKAGKSKPSRELTGIKARLSGLADDVLAGRTDKGVAAVASQVLNVYLRAVSVEMKVKEVTELEERISVLEASKAKKGEQRWGA